MNQNGYTLIEVMVVGAVLSLIGVGVFAVYAVVHFILKFW